MKTHYSQDFSKKDPFETGCPRAAQALNGVPSGNLYKAMENSYDSKKALWATFVLLRGALPEAIIMLPVPLPQPSQLTGICDYYGYGFPFRHISKAPFETPLKEAQRQQQKKPSRV